VSLLEAIAAFESRLGRTLRVEYSERNRVGDHICYISDMRRLEADYPGWRQEYTLERTLDEIVAAVTAPAA
jgi:CDP-paratose 2-epimerase